ncbi:MAG: hypothetical protein FJX73_03500 [Armatimonadetes bacterium]|nr:hypothetical protein [Armatimonadota bacterium]
MAIEQIKNFVQVDNRLGTAGQPTEDQLREVAASGYEVVVNLGLLDPRYCLPDEAGLVQALGLEYHAIPVKFDAPAVEEFLQFLVLMDRCRARRTFVHCAANYRVSSFVALYGQARLGWTAQQADAHARRFWDLDDVWMGFIQACRRRLGLEG